MTESSADVLREVSAAREAALVAYRERNLSGYLKVFAPELEYVDLDGTVRTREQMRADVEREWLSMKDVRLEYRRVEHALEGDRFMEVIEQQASAVLHAFFFLKRSLTSRRLVQTWWERREGGWRIVRAEVRQDDRTLSPLSFGWSVPRLRTDSDDS